MRLPVQARYSDNCLTAFKELEKQYDGLHMVVLSNQGNYITIVIQSILTSMVVALHWPSSCWPSS